eukprot:3341825-Pleurochrysis_carterae.AAC.4
MAAAAGVGRVWCGSEGLLSTPAMSAVIRTRARGLEGMSPFGGFILSASHNPGGIDEDFGIKYNCENGGPAPEKLTNLMHKNTESIKEYSICSSLPDLDLSKPGSYSLGSLDNPFKVEVFDPTEDHVMLLKQVARTRARRSTLPTAYLASYEGAAAVPFAMDMKARRGSGFASHGTHSFEELNIQTAPDSIAGLNLRHAHLRAVAAASCRPISFVFPLPLRNLFGSTRQCRCSTSAPSRPCSIARTSASSMTPCALMPPAACACRPSSANRVRTMARLLANFEPLNHPIQLHAFASPPSPPLCTPVRSNSPRPR